MGPKPALASLRRVAARRLDAARLDLARAQAAEEAARRAMEEGARRAARELALSAQSLGADQPPLPSGPWLLRARRQGQEAGAANAAARGGAAAARNDVLAAWTLAHAVQEMLRREQAARATRIAAAAERALDERMQRAARHNHSEND